MHMPWCHGSHQYTCRGIIMEEVSFLLGMCESWKAFKRASQVSPFWFKQIAIAWAFTYQGSHKRQTCTIGASPTRYIHTCIHKIYTYINANKNTETNKIKLYLQTHANKINYNQNKNCFSLYLKNVRGADNMSYGVKFQKNTEFTKRNSDNYW